MEIAISTSSLLESWRWIRRTWWLEEVESLLGGNERVKVILWRDSRRLSSACKINWIGLLLMPHPTEFNDLRLLPYIHVHAYIFVIFLHMHYFEITISNGEHRTLLLWEQVLYEYEYLPSQLLSSGRYLKRQLVVRHGVFSTIVTTIM